MTYIKTVEINIVRTKHEIRFNNKSTIEDVLFYLKNVPEFSSVDEFFVDEKTDECVIIFHNDKRTEG